MNEVIGDRLVYALYRCATRVAHATGRLDAKRMKKLNQTAMFDELLSLGYNQVSMAADLGVAQASINTWKKEANKPWHWPEAGPLVRRILDELQAARGPLGENVLAERCRGEDRESEEEDDFGFELNFNLALRRNIGAGWVSERRRREAIEYELTPAYHALLKVHGQQPFTAECGDVDTVLAICRHLLAKGAPQSEASLLAAGPLHHRGHSTERIADALAWAKLEEADGRSVGIVSDVQGGERFYWVHPEARVQLHDDPTGAVHVTSLEIVRRAEEFLVMVLGDYDKKLTAMRSYDFKVRPSLFPALMKEHYDHWVSILKAAEKESKGASDLQGFSFTWLGGVRKDP